MTGVQQIRVKAGEADSRLDRWFKRRFPHLSHGQLEKLLRKGQIRVDGGRAKANTRLEAGQTVRVPPLDDAPERADRSGPTPADAALIRSLVIHQDDAVIALNKPPGLAAQGGSKITRHVDGLLDALAKDGERPRLAHRLDKDTSGVLLLGRTANATAALARAFQSRRAEKTYWAVVLGAPRPGQGTIKGFMKKGTEGRAEKERMIAAEHGDEGAQYAKSRFSVISEAGRRASWVALRPESGRTHQLRFHMAEIGYPIAGDRKYVCDRPPLLEVKGLMLHARSIALDHPNGGRLTVNAPLSKPMAGVFDALGFRTEDYVEPEWPED
ncbi:MAG: RluA family pseudouridine synthase [Maricaulaceae bacterium]